MAQPRLKVGILGATGMVGQRFLTLLEHHPWFTVTLVAASASSAGKTYAQAVEGRWAMATPIPKAAGALTVLDASQVALIAPQVDFVYPDLIKPNKAELEGWLGRTIDTDEALFEAVRALRSAGARSVAVSLGGDGAWLFHGEGAWHVNGLQVEAKSTVGAGDALLGALTAGLAAGKNPGEALARAAATATASVVRAGTGVGDPQDIEAFLARLAIRHHPFSGRKS